MRVARAAAALFLSLLHTAQAAAVMDTCAAGRGPRVRTLGAGATTTKVPPMLPARGLVLIGDIGVPVGAYDAAMTAVKAAADYALGGKMLFDLEVQLVTVEHGADEDTATVAGRAVTAMAAVSAECKFWGVVGHGAGGGAVASLLAKAMHPRVTTLALVDGTPDPSVGDSLRDANLQCILLTSDGTGAGGTYGAPPQLRALAAQLQRHPGDVLIADLQAAPPSNGRGASEAAAAVGDVAGGAGGADSERFPAGCHTAFGLRMGSALGELHFPPMLEEGRPYLESSDDVVVEEVEKEDGVRWLSFHPRGATAPLPALLYVQGIAVPIEAYAGLMQRIARLGYLCVLLAAPARDPFQLPVHVFDEVMDAQPPERASGDWFVGGHSGGSLATCAWLRSQLDESEEQQQRRKRRRLRGAVLMAGSPVGSVFTDTPAARAFPFIQVVGTRDTGYRRQPDALQYYVGALVRPLVPEKSITVAPVEGGSHYAFAYIGYKAPYLMGTATYEAQQEAGAAALHEWMQRILT